MPETMRSRTADGAPADSGANAGAEQLVGGWRDGLAIVNLRGDANDDGFVRAAAAALGVELPLEPCTTREGEALRVLWAGPDDWFLIGPRGDPEALVARLREALAGCHHAVTDVSSGYTVLQLAGPPVREILAQGCPLDLHARAFARGMCAGSHFFKASVWVWQSDDAPAYELLVRRSFMGYVWLMLERASQECGLVTRRFA